MVVTTIRSCWSVWKHYTVGVGKGEDDNAFHGALDWLFIDGISV